MERFPMPSDHVSLNLVATLGGRRREKNTERLATPADLDAWYRLVGVTAAPASDHDLQRARRLREAIFLLVTAAHAGTAPPEAAIECVNDLASGPRQLRWRADGFTTEPSPEGNDPLRAIAFDAVAVLTGPEAARLSQCEADGCATWFVQHAGSRRRRWCSAAGCGNRARVGAYRQRAAE